MGRPLKPPPPSDIAARFHEDPSRFAELLERMQRVDIRPVHRRRYLHWDKLRQLEPPEGLSHEEWWLGVKLARSSLYRPLPFTDVNGTPFQYAYPDEAQELLHFIDQQASGALAMPENALAGEESKNHYFVNAQAEEAIRSSQLEGATTSRKTAREMIRVDRRPRDRSEQMILNNYRALEFMHEQGGERLTPRLVLELHRILTEETLDHPDASGRLQRSDEERVAVFDQLTGERVHAPPPAEELPGRLKLLCRFANEEVKDAGFMHPVVRAILLHFQMAYDHPFEDGNGRTARALFYWSMRKSGYWLTEYLSISRILRQAPGQYARSFLHAETDDGDTTYFVLYQLAVIKRAIEEFQAYVARKVAEVRQVERLIEHSDVFNYRQLALLSHALRDPGAHYTFMSHARSHRVTRPSARTDLLELAGLGLLEQRRVGKKFVFAPVSGLAERLGRI